MNRILLFELLAGTGMVDTGCCSAVGGGLQQTMYGLGLAIHDIST